MRLTKMQSENLKWIAIILMLVDHIGLMFFPHVIEWRLIGRLAFPLFAFQLAMGYQFTRSPKIQLRNLFIFAVISQIPFQLAVQPGEWTANIFFTLALGYLLMMSLTSKYRTLYIPIILVAGFLLPLDYGIYGVLLPVLFYVCRDYPARQFITFALATVLYVIFLSPYQIYAIGAFLLIVLVRFLPSVSIQTSKWFFYSFYPAHLILLYTFDTWS